MAGHTFGTMLLLALVLMLLPAAVVFAASINVFKKEIDVHFKNVIYIV